MILEPRPVKVSTRTGVDVMRTLPNVKLKHVSAWCFVDHFGPSDQTDSMVVAKHPHMGLQTVTWLLEGEVEHRDSVGSVQVIEPGQLNVMTAARGIAHSELSIKKNGNLHAVQLWLALPDSARNIDSSFEHLADLPLVHGEGFSARVMIGEFAAASAPTRVFNRLVAAEIRIPAGQSATLKLNPDFEHGLFVVQSSATIAGEQVNTSNMQTLPTGTELVNVTAAASQEVILLLLGGEPFEEQIVMWWNFIARSHSEIVEARAEWNARSPRFGDFEDHIGGWIEAPQMPNVTLRPR